MGIKGPREMTVYIPRVNDNTLESNVFKQTKNDYNLMNAFDDDGYKWNGESMFIEKLENKKPRWVESKNSK